MYSEIRRFAASLVGMLVLSAVTTAHAAPPLLTLDQALQEALTRSPRIASAEAAIKSADGTLYQAGAYPNPELGIEGENVAGSGSYRGIRSADITYGLSQQIEIGGKRDARQDAAEFRRQAALLEAQRIRLDVARDVKQAFAAAVAAQESQRLAEDALDIAGQELKSVSRRVAEAASPLIQKSKAEVTLATARFNVEQARQEASVTRGQLAILLGRSTLPETLDASSFFDVTEPASTEEAAIEHTPDMMLLRAEEAQAEAALEIQKASAVPDPTVSVGVRELRETSDHAFVVGLSIPLPVLNSNQGNIDAARAEKARTESDQHVVRLALLQRYAEAKGALRTAYVKATSYKTTVLPAAEQAFALSRQGYGAGKFQYLEVLDAQRTLFDARAQYMSALRDYHMRKADLERLSTPSTPIEGEAHARN